MKKIPRIGFLVVILLSLGSGLPAAQSAQAASPWVVGLYSGWAYFMAKTDYHYSQSMEGASMQFDGVKFFESHGDIECNVIDEAGTGGCGANFPLDILNGASGLFTGPDCTVSVQVNSRANALSGGMPLAPLSSGPLEVGFSVPFNPLVGPENGMLSATTSGCPGGGANSYQIDPGQPKWPQLDFHVDYHTALSIGGTCSMEGLPRSITAGAMTATLSLTQCQWRVLYLDPYAKLP